MRLSCVHTICLNLVKMKVYMFSFPMDSSKYIIQIVILIFATLIVKNGMQMVTLQAVFTLLILMKGLHSKFVHQSLFETVIIYSLILYCRFIVIWILMMEHGLSSREEWMDQLISISIGLIMRMVLVILMENSGWD